MVVMRHASSLWSIMLGAMGTYIVLGNASDEPINGCYVG
jgi:hypothetical protein